MKNTSAIFVFLSFFNCLDRWSFLREASYSQQTTKEGGGGLIDRERSGRGVKRKRERERERCVKNKKKINDWIRDYFLEKKRKNLSSHICSHYSYIGKG